MPYKCFLFLLALFQAKRKHWHDAIPPTHHFRNALPTFFSVSCPIRLHFFLLLAPNKLWRLFYYTTPPSRNVSHVIFFQRCSFFLFLLLRFFFNEADNVARLCLFFLLHPVVQHRSRFSNMKKTPAFLIGWPMRWRKAHLCFCLGWPTKIATMLANHCCYLPFFFLSVLVPFLINGPVVRMVAFTHGLA